MNDIERRFDRVWARLQYFEGSTFLTKTGLPFDYRLEKYLIWVDRSIMPIMRRDLERVYDRWLVEGFEGMPLEFRNEYANSYVRSFLNDPRIVNGPCETCTRFDKESPVSCAT